MKLKDLLIESDQMEINNILMEQQMEINNIHRLMEQQMEENGEIDDGLFKRAKKKLSDYIDNIKQKIGKEGMEIEDEKSKFPENYEEKRAKAESSVVKLANATKDPELKKKFEALKGHSITKILLGVAAIALSGTSASLLMVIPAVMGFVTVIIGLLQLWALSGR